MVFVYFLIASSIKQYKFALKLSRQTKQILKASPRRSQVLIGIWNANKLIDELREYYDKSSGTPNP